MLEPEERSLGKVSEQAVRPATPYVYFAREEIEQSIVALCQQVRKAPEQLAVRSASCQWSYRELDQRSDQIARGIVRCCGRERSTSLALGARCSDDCGHPGGAQERARRMCPRSGASLARLAHIIEDAQAHSH